jgi:hypothetical protein
MGDDSYFAIPPYSLNKESKHALLSETLNALTRHHYQGCPQYQRILDSMRFDTTIASSYYELPFLPARLFKEYELLSVDRGNIVKTMNSSGTSGQQVSQIFLDKGTAAQQIKALSKIVGFYIGKKRLPMLILDSPAVIENRGRLSARGAGILGFSMFSCDRVFALDENMQLDTDGITAFLQKHEGKSILLFGFTFMIWQHFYEELVRTGFRPDFSNGTILHGGGWKKLADQAVSPAAFKKALRDVCGIQRIYDYYGMVEQTGSVYLECEQGHLHASIFSDVIIRRARDFSVADIGEKGIIQVLSILAYSYPGHSLLTEDEGVLLGEDDCPCGRLGKYFRVSGRLENAEIRGCSDTYADRTR